MRLTLLEICELVDGRLIGDGEVHVTGVSSLEQAGAGDLAAFEDARLKDRALESGATALLVKPELAENLTVPCVAVPFPQIALNRVIERLGLAPARPAPGIHPTAQVHPEAVLGAEVSVGPHAVIGAGAEVGAHSVIHAHAVLEPGCKVGERCELQAHSVVTRYARLGHDVAVGASAVIGASGFGFSFGPRGAERLYHLGTVEVGDRAEIGAGTTIDRARFGVTRIGVGTKIDSQVHVAHNCTIDDHTVLAAQVGIAGSTHIGKQCLVGGQAGFAGHLRIGDRVNIAAKTGIGSDLTEPGNYFGWWAKERGTSFRELAAVAKLPEALRELRRLKQEVENLRESLNTTNT